MAHDSPTARREHDGTPISQLQDQHCAATRPVRRWLTFWGLGLACAAIWLCLLLATNFSGVIVALGLIIAVVILT